MVGDSTLGSQGEMPWDCTLTILGGITAYFSKLDNLKKHQSPKTQEERIQCRSRCGVSVLFDSDLVSLTGPLTLPFYRRPSVYNLLRFDTLKILVHCGQGQLVI